MNSKMIGWVLSTAFVLACPINAQVTQPKFSHPPGDYVTVHGYKLWYESEGSGQPLVLISGGPGLSHSYFHPYFSALANSYRVIYFDSLGRGRSDRANNPSEYTFDRDVEDAEGLRKALGLQKVALFGHSYGGLVAQAYALRFPDSVQKLILSNSPFDAEMCQASNDHSNSELRNQFPEIWEKIAAIRERGFHTCSKQYQEANIAPGGFLYFYDASAESKLAPFVESFNLDVYCSISGEDADYLVGGTVASLDFRMRLQELHMPVLILAGRYDRVVPPRFTLQYRRYAPQAEFVMFEKSGHFPFIEMQDEMFKKVREFLQK